MVVARGMNSSDWNAAAGAWNTLRAAWLAAVHAVGHAKDLERVCPGKVMRLMAADVARWHKASGKGLDKNTAAFAELPLPWEVVLGRARCTAKNVRLACVAAGLDPEKSGWLAPTPPGVPEPMRPTPALVHGVVVSSPGLADLLRRAGWFEGRGRKARRVPNVFVRRDKHGFALSARHKAKPVAKKRKSHA
jgi:hypothetical protein